jgi:NADH-quinone oxidoreductase subunit A
VENHLPLIVMLVLAAGFVLLSLVTTKLLASARPTPAKSAPYESGIVPKAAPPERFPVRFYLVAMIFIVFDIEIVFLYPWAVIYRDLGGFGLVEMLAFAVAVFVSFLYMLSRGALDWGPVKRLRRLDARDPGRTATTTIRRVGLEGRGDGGQPAQGPSTREVAAS